MVSNALVAPATAGGVGSSRNNTCRIEGLPGLETVLADRLVNCLAV
jgi:hypothetical protein